MYSNNDFRLYHSYKGTTWKNHLYTAKKTVGGRMRYFYRDPGEGLSEHRALSEATRNRVRNQKAADEAESIGKKNEAETWEALANFDQLINTYANKFKNEYEKLWKDSGFYEWSLADLSGDAAKAEAVISELINKVDEKYKALKNRTDSEERRAKTAAAAADSAYSMSNKYRNNANRAAGKVEDIKRRRTV